MPCVALLIPRDERTREGHGGSRGSQGGTREGMQYIAFGNYAHRLPGAQRIKELRLLKMKHFPPRLFIARDFCLGLNVALVN